LHEDLKKIQSGGFITKIMAYSGLKKKSILKLFRRFLSVKIKEKNIIFTDKWRGQFNLSEKDSLRFKKLRNRYVD
jgi:hypothetical protein